MQTTPLSKTQHANPEFLNGGGEMAKLISEFDWSATSLGKIENWPQSLKTATNIMLQSPIPMVMLWGKDGIMIYNDGYSVFAGGRHPQLLGSKVLEGWAEVADFNQHVLNECLAGRTLSYKDTFLILSRRGIAEEVNMDLNYSPIMDETGKPAGVLAIVVEITQRTINERALATLRELGAITFEEKSLDVIYQNLAVALGKNNKDFPFAVVYKVSEDGRSASITSDAGIESTKYFPETIDLTHLTKDTESFYNAYNKNQFVLSAVQHHKENLPKGFWDVSPSKLIYLPVSGAGKNHPYAIIVAALNPYRVFDEVYEQFCQLLSERVSLEVNKMLALEEERKRAEALAEIDKAKTTFFSNISHEFRTPLTLLLGPMEEIMFDENTIPINKTRIQTAYRNALRMQKLVNTLLDFSKIEAGRMEGKFSKVDICTLTQDLASTFRSAIEKAGMQLLFNCNNVLDDVYVDEDMWEKIVLNLVSNAFKYSNAGSIKVNVKQVDDKVQLDVTDTGVGIPPEHLDKIFDRFHRVDSAQGRSQEGTGIGLAMVKELVKLHDGTIEVKSEAGKGSTFTVKIPIGKDHLPAEKIVALEKSERMSISEAYVQEAGKWIDGNEDDIDAPVNNIKREHPVNAFKVLVADDNADMRDYIHRLLSDKFEVITATNGEEAFEKVSKVQPDLIISDIMMPRLDGFGFLKQLRQHPDTKNIPVIFLSARAGEEAKVEGLEAGADDYLVKPFAAKELIARVEGNIKIAQSRISAEKNLRNIITQAPVAMAILKGKDHVMEIANEKALEIWQKNYDDIINKPAFDSFPELVSQGFKQILDNVFAGERFVANEMPIELIRNGKRELLYVSFTYEPLLNLKEEIEGIAVVGIDVTQQVIARKEIEQSEKELNQLANAVPQLVWVADSNGIVNYYNERVTEFAGASKNDDGKWRWEGMVHNEDIDVTNQAWNNAVANGTPYQAQHRIQMKDGSYRWFLSRAFPYKDPGGNIIKWFGTATDIHTEKENATVLEEKVKLRTAELQQMNESLQQSNNELQQFAHVASHDLKEPLRKIKTFTGRLADDEANKLSERSGTFLDKINSAAERMQSMIDGVLNYSMLNAATQSPEKVDLNKVVSDIQNDLEILIQQTGATINKDTLHTIEGAPILIYQLFYNLVYNSLKFAKPDTSPVIKILSNEVNDGDRRMVNISISDNGIGFRQEYADKIFETFSRLNPKDRFEGTGLGLSLCKRIVERHGGTINASGKEGEGATFTITLPVKQMQQMI